jgi:hypothetical protein
MRTSAAAALLPWYLLGDLVLHATDRGSGRLLSSYGSALGVKQTAGSKARSRAERSSSRTRWDKMRRGYEYHRELVTTHLRGRSDECALGATESTGVRQRTTREILDLRSRRRP